MITIVTDSSAYLKECEAAELGVRLVPLVYTVDGQPCYESYSDRNGDFESLIGGRAKVTTSQPSAAAFLSCFEEELKKGNEVLCVTLSSRLSGTYRTAYMAARHLQDRRVAVFDSLFTGGGQHLLIREARRLIDCGLTLSEVLLKLPAVRDRITSAFSVEDLAPLRESGRLGFVRLRVSTILNMRPILLCRDGVVVFDSVAHGNAEMVKKLFQMIPAGVKEIVLNHAGNNRVAANLYNVVNAAFPSAKIRLRKIGPVLGIHLGPRATSVAFMI